MTALDKIRLIGLLRKSPASAGLFYFPGRVAGANGSSAARRRQPAGRRHPASTTAADAQRATGAIPDVD